MNATDTLVNKLLKNSSVEKTLKFAYDICAKNTFIYDETIDRLYVYTNGYYKVIKSGIRGANIERVIMSHDGGETLSVSARSAVIRNIQAISAVEINGHSTDYVNFKNCLFNTSTMQTEPHASKIYSTNRIPIEYDKDAKCEMWQSFLQDIMNNEQNKIDVLQEFIGYCFVKTCKYEKALVIPGGGQNGKGTFTHVIHHLIGVENISSASLEHLADDVRRSSILNKYVNIDTEVPKRSERFEAAFKQIVSGEHMLFNEKYIAPYSKAPFCKLIFAANKMPRIDETTMGFYRRLIVIPFSKTITEEDKDIDLKYKLLVELPGIFNWAMVGLTRLMANMKFTDTDSSIVSDLRKENSPMLQYADENLEFHGNNTYGVTKKNLYKDFVVWAKEMGYKQPSYKTFNGDFFEEFGHITKKEKQCGIIETKDRFWPGISRKGNTTIGECITGWTE